MKNVYYINLDTRTDRKVQVESELEALGWSYERFNAIKNKNGRIGCSMSHLKILQMAKEKNLEYVVVVEDDIQFTKPNVFNTQISQFLTSEIAYDVLLLAGNLFNCPTKQISTNVYQVFKCWTTTGYIVKRHYYDTLIHNIKQGILQLCKNPAQHGRYAIDAYWQVLQQQDSWYILRPRTVIQRPDFSDIEQRNINYNHLMID